MTDEGAISPKSLPPGGKVPPKGADEVAMIERFRSSQGDISPPAGGEFLSQRWERNQRIAGGRGRRALRAHRTAYPRSPITGVTTLAWRWISGAQNLSGWSKFPPGHWALGLQKLGPGAVPKRRLGFLSQRSRCVFTVGAAFGRPRARTARPYTGIAKDGTLGCPKRRSTSVRPLRKTGGVLVIL